MPTDSVKVLVRLFGPLCLGAAVMLLLWLSIGRRARTFWLFCWVAPLVLWLAAGWMVFDAQSDTHSLAWALVVTLPVAFLEFAILAVVGMDMQSFTRAKDGTDAATWIDGLHAPRQRNLSQSGAGKGWMAQKAPSGPFDAAARVVLRQSIVVMWAMIVPGIASPFLGMAGEIGWGAGVALTLLSMLVCAPLVARRRILLAGEIGRSTTDAVCQVSDPFLPRIACMPDPGEAQFVYKVGTERWIGFNREATAGLPLVVSVARRTYVPELPSLTKSDWNLLVWMGRWP